MKNVKYSRVLSLQIFGTFYCASQPKLLEYRLARIWMIEPIHVVVVFVIVFIERKIELMQKSIFFKGYFVN